MKHKNIFFLILILGFGISAFYLYEFWKVFPPNSINVNWQINTLIFLVMGIALQIVGHFLRAYKWRILLREIRPTKTRTLFKGVAVGFLYNSLLPFRIGEFIRADFVGRSMRISRSVVFGTIILERIIDGLILVALVTALIFFYPLFNSSSDLRPILAGLTGVLILGAIIVGLIFSQNRSLLKFIRSFTALLNDKMRDRLRFVAWSTIYGLRVIASRANLMLYLGLSLVMWICYLSSIALIIGGLISFSGLVNLIFSSSISYLSVAVPSGPAYLGTYHYFFTSIVSHLLADGAYAASITTWVAMTLPISLIGVALLIVDRRPVRQASEAERAIAMLNKLYRDYDISSELSQFLDTYFSGAELSHALSKAEISGRMKLLRTYKGGSNAITMLANIDGETRVRKMTLPQHAEKLRAQHDWLQERSDIPHLPRIVQQDFSPGQYSFDIEYKKDFQPFFDYIHSREDAENREVIERVVEFMHRHIYKPGSPADARKNVLDYINSKVIGKLQDTMALNGAIATLSQYESLEINGVSYDNWQIIVKKILKDEKIMADLSSYSEGPIHGDLTIDNIIVNPSTRDFIVLDPNNENQVSSPVVDMAKLYQSLHSGYEFLCNLESANVNENKIRFEEHVSSRYTKLLSALDERLKRDMSEAEYRTIVFHEAVHYCRMLPYRAKINPNSLPAFYAVAVRLLNNFYMNYEKR